MNAFYDNFLFTLSVWIRPWFFFFLLDDLSFISLVENTTAIKLYINENTASLIYNYVLLILEKYWSRNNYSQLLPYGPWSIAYGLN